MGIFEREKIAEIDERAQEQRQNREYLVRSNKRAGKRERKKKEKKRKEMLLSAYCMVFIYSSCSYTGTLEENGPKCCD